MKNIFKVLMLMALVATLTSCTSLNSVVREPNTKVLLSKSDFTLSKQVSAEAKTVKIVGIDWSRIFIIKTGEVNRDGLSGNVSAASIPVIGSFIGDKTESYALHELMISNPGYDVVFYPQFETKKFAPGLGLFYNVTTVKATARLGKLTE
tara:strand:- start:676 stop:1125 length:450 start_codon:yes stop_codon:yes gene_type:complete